MDVRGARNPWDWILDEVLESHHGHLVVIEQRIDAVGHPTYSLLGVVIYAIPLDDIASDFDVLADGTFGYGQHHIATAQRTIVLRRTEPHASATSGLDALAR